MKFSYTQYHLKKLKSKSSTHPSLEGEKKKKKKEKRENRGVFMRREP